MPEELHSWYDLSLVAQDDEKKHVIVSERETIQSIVNQKQFQGKIDSFLESSCPPLAGGPKSMISRRGKINCHVGGNGNLSLNNFGEDIPLTCTPKVRFSSLRTASSPARGEEFLDAQWKNSRKIAFTLAETLITLGIIGVVAVLTLPSVVKHYKAKVLEVAFKKSVSNLYQAYDMTKQELGVENIYQTYVVYDGVGYAAKSAEFRNAFGKNLKVVGKYNRDFYPIYNYNGTKYITQNLGNDYPQATKILADGSSFGMWANGDGYNGIFIHLFIDTNGPYKGPNKYGHDIFKFDIRKDNKIHPIAMGELKTEEELENVVNPDLFGYPCSIKSKQASNGAGCSYYAMNNINPDDNTKKYWDSLP